MPSTLHTITQPHDVHKHTHTPHPQPYMYTHRANSNPNIINVLTQVTTTAISRRGPYEYIYNSRIKWCVHIVVWRPAASISMRRAGIENKTLNLLSIKYLVSIKANNPKATASSPPEWTRIWWWWGCECLRFVYILDGVCGCTFLREWGGTIMRIKRVRVFAEMTT